MAGRHAGRSGAGWRKVRAEVLATSDVCHYCGRPGATTVDHYPVSRADCIALGRLDLLEDKSNLRPAHRSCNSRAGRHGVKWKATHGLGRTSRDW